MDYKNEKELIDLYLAGNCTDAERERVERWYIQRSRVAKDVLPEPDYEEVKRTMWQNISFKNKPSRLLFPYKKIAIAASILLFSSVTLYLYLRQVEKNNIQTAVAEVLPGKNEATLTLASGRKILLSDVTKGTLVENDDIQISKKEDGKLVYRASELTDLSLEHSSMKAEETKYNVLNTPRGGQYQIELSDGTKIWLNAESTLKFPANFSGANERRVMLIGEAYLEVAKNKKQPFIIISGNQEVQILGTHFNLSAYPNEKAITTTLIEGAVKVSLTVEKERNFKILRPGQQSIVLQNGQSKEAILVKEADIEEAVAWKSGYFKFNESLEGVMRKISRWYGVEVIYDANVDLKQAFGGKVSRSRSIYDVLKIMESTGNIHFKLEGRRIMVMK